MRLEAAARSARVAVDALDRWANKCREAAAFLRSHNVPPAPIVEENIQPTFWSRPKKPCRAISTGWGLKDAYGLALAVDGGLWQHGFDDQDLCVTWYPEHGFMEDGNSAIRFRPNIHESYEFDIEAGSAAGVVELATRYSQ